MSKKVLCKTKFIRDIVNTDYKGHQANCAAGLGVTASYISKIMNSTKDIEAGPSLPCALELHCVTHGRNVKDYFFIR